MEMIYSDGGRNKYFKGETGDCVTRAICNATGKDYLDVYNALNELGKSENVKHHRCGKHSNARTGVFKETIRNYLESIGWEWIPTMQISSGCTVHLKAEELPKGTLIVNVSKHTTCIKDGVLYDTYDCSRDGTRCVYGYYTKESE